MKKVVYTKEREVVDSTTGELLSSERVDIKVPFIEKEDFCFMFERLVQTVLQLNGNEVKVFLYCSLNCNIGENTIILISKTKKQMSKEIGIALGSINNSISSLVKKGYLFREDTSCYKVHPAISWRGKADKRMDGGNRQIVIDFVKQLKNETLAKTIEVLIDKFDSDLTDNNTEIDLPLEIGDSVELTLSNTEKDCSKKRDELPFIRENIWCRITGHSGRTIRGIIVGKPKSFPEAEGLEISFDWTVVRNWVKEGGELK